MVYEESYNLSHGLDDGSMLFLHYQHQSKAICEGNDLGVLRIRHYKMMEVT